MTKQEKLIEKVDHLIATLVREKEDIRRARNYYSGIIDEETFRSLEENHGLGVSTTVKHIPLTRKHVDGLVNEYISFPIIAHATCKDPSTISKIDTETRKKVAEEVITAFRNKFIENVTDILGGKSLGLNTNIIEYLNNVKERATNDFVSDYEKAVQVLINHILVSTDINIKTKLQEIIKDAVTTGEAYYQTKPNIYGEDVELEVLDPANVFININPSNPIVNKSQEVVIRRWMSFYEILKNYGEFITQAEINDLKDNWNNSSISWNGNTYWYKRTCGDTVPINGTMYDGVFATIDGKNSYNLHNRFIPVYEVQWLESVKKDGKYRVERYTQICINNSIYIINEKPDKEAIRSRTNPNSTTLSVNGIHVLDKNGKPYSLALALSDLQDEYNEAWFCRQVLVKSAGTIGERMDVSKLPEFLGDSLSERLLKWLAYSKGGVKLYNSAQDEARESQNTIVGSYDETLNINAVQAYNLYIASIEESASLISGMFRQRLDGIKQYDSVKGIEVGVQNSYISTGDWYLKFDNLLCSMLTDTVNLSKKVYKKGITGAIRLGDEGNKVFTASPEHYSLSDHDIFITNAQQAKLAMERLKATTDSLIASGQVQVDVLISTIDSNSITDYKREVIKSLNTTKKFTDQINQLNSKVVEYESTINQLNSELEKLSKQYDEYKKQELALKEQELKVRSEVEWYKAKSDDAYKKEKNKIEAERTKIELKQLYDGNPYNDQIRMD